MSEPPVVLRRRLARELKKLRLDLGLTLEHVKDGAKLGLSTLSRYENAQSVPKFHDFEALLHYYVTMNAKAGRELPADRLDELRDVRKRASSRGWWKTQFGVSVPDWYEDYVSLEMAASEVRIFHVFVPGLFQTRDYAKAVISAGPKETAPEDIDRLVNIRESRQRRLGEPGFSVDAVIDEAALHREIGTKEVMRAQMLRLLELATMPTLTIRVLPYRRAAYAAAIGSGFSILGFPDSEEVTYLEHYAVGHYVEGPEQVADYRLGFQLVAEQAYDREQSITALAKASELWA